MAYRETSARAAWYRENTLHVSVRISKNQDPELYKLLSDAKEQGKSQSGVIRDILHEYIQQK